MTDVVYGKTQDGKVVRDFGGNPFTFLPWEDAAAFFRDILGYEDGEITLYMGDAFFIKDDDAPPKKTYVPTYVLTLQSDNELAELRKLSKARVPLMVPGFMRSTQPKEDGRVQIALGPLTEGQKDYLRSGETFLSLEEDIE